MTIPYPVEILDQHTIDEYHQKYIEAATRYKAMIDWGGRFVVTDYGSSPDEAERNVRKTLGEHLFWESQRE